MPDYGVGTPAWRPLPWSWAVERLMASHDYWVATNWPGRPPHVMPVWGVWVDEVLWFSSGLRSRKARNLAADGRCTVATDDAVDPVVLQGSAERITDLPAVQAFVDAVNAKYDTSYGLDFFDPAVNAAYRVRPAWAFGLVQDDFGGSPTRWTFGDL